MASSFHHGIGTHRGKALPSRSAERTMGVWGTLQDPSTIRRRQQPKTTPGKIRRRCPAHQNAADGFLTHLEAQSRFERRRCRSCLGEKSLLAVLQWNAVLLPSGTNRSFKHDSLALSFRRKRKPLDVGRFNVDTTVQTNAIRYPSDARLCDRVRERLV